MTVLERYVLARPVQEFVLKYVSVAIKLFATNQYDADIKNNVFYVIENIIKFSFDEFISEIKNTFISLKEELKSIKDKKIHEICRILGIFQKSPLRENKIVTPENSQKLMSIYTIPKGRVMSDLEKVRKKRNERQSQEKQIFEKRNLSEKIQKKSLKKQIEKRRFELGVLSKNEENIIFVSETTDKEAIISLFRIQEETTDDQAMIEIVSKKYFRAIKLLFSKYAGSSSYIKKISPIPTFDRIQDLKENLSESEFSRLLRENEISSIMISTEELKQVYKTLTGKLKVNAINFENFLDLLYMTALLIFTRHPYDYSNFPSAICYELLFEAIKSSADMVSKN